MIADNAADIRKALEAIKNERAWAKAKVEAARRNAATGGSADAKAEAELGAAKPKATKTDGDEQMFRGFFLTEDGDIRPTQ